MACAINGYSPMTLGPIGRTTLIHRSGPEVQDPQFHNRSGTLPNDGPSPDRPEEGL
jgi:hypothetical protein